MASDLDTLQQIAVYMYQIPGGKNLLWFTSGSNLLLRPDPASVSMDPGARRAIYDLLESERNAIYPIDARGLTVVFGRAVMVTATQQMQMRQDAAATGGAAYVNTNSLAQATQHILATDGNYYTLSYTPNDLKSNSKWHRVEVKLMNAHYELSYRHGYFDDDSDLGHNRRWNRRGKQGSGRRCGREGTKSRCTCRTIKARRLSSLFGSRRRLPQQLLCRRIRR